MTTKTNEYDDLTQIETNYCKSDWYNDNVNVNDDDLCIQFYLHCLHVLCNLRIHCNRIEVKLAYVEQQTTLSQHRPTYTHQNNPSDETIDGHTKPSKRFFQPRP